MKRAAAVRPPLFLGLMTCRLAYGKKTRHRRQSLYYPSLDVLIGRCCALV